MNLPEYFVELLDKNILIDFPKNNEDPVLKIEGVSRHDYSISTLSDVLKELANIAEVLENILSHLKHENNTEYYIEFDKDIQDFKNEIKFQFSFKLTNKTRKVEIYNKNSDWRDSDWNYNLFDFT